MISMQLATKLRDAGLAWKPTLHDAFVIPDHDLDGRVFTLNDMSTELRHFADQSAITFNGAVEWSLDWIMREEVVWIPSERQLRELVGGEFVALERHDDRYVCRVRRDGRAVDFLGDTASEAYGNAVLAAL